MTPCSVSLYVTSFPAERTLQLWHGRLLKRGSTRYDAPPLLVAGSRCTLVAASADLNAGSNATMATLIVPGGIVGIISCVTANTQSGLCKIVRAGSNPSTAMDPNAVHNKTPYGNTMCQMGQRMATRLARKLLQECTVIHTNQQYDCRAKNKHIHFVAGTSQSQIGLVELSNSRPDRRNAFS